MITVHIADDFNENRTAGTLCGMTFGVEPWDAEVDAVIMDWDEYPDVTCQPCLALASVERHLSSVPHPQPVKVRVYELVKEAGLEESRPVLRVLDDLGYAVKAPASALHLEGFEHEALVAMLEDL